MDFGEVLYTNQTVVKYRRLEKNATAEGQNALQIFLWRMEKLLTQNGMKDIKDFLKAQTKHYEAANL